MNFSRSRDINIIAKKRLTLEEIYEKYPDEWLFIVDCEHSENTELLSGCILVHSKSRDDIYEASGHYKGGAAIRFTGDLPEGVRYLL